MKKKRGVFDEAIGCCLDTITLLMVEPGPYSKPKSAELRAAIATLKACERLVPLDDPDSQEWYINGEGPGDRDRFCRAILRARKIAARRKK